MLNCELAGYIKFIIDIAFTGKLKLSVSHHFHSSNTHLKDISFTVMLNMESWEKRTIKCLGHKKGYLFSGLNNGKYLSTLISLPLIWDSNYSPKQLKPNEKIIPVLVIGYAQFLYSFTY